MTTAATQILFCPIRKRLEVPATAADALTPTEEARRIHCVNALLARDIPPEHILIERTLQRLGHEGTKSIRADLVVLDVPKDTHTDWTTDLVLDHAWAIAEIKRDPDSAESAKEYQVKPAVRLARPHAIGIYWDGEEQTLLWQSKQADATVIWQENDFSTLPPLGASPEARPVTYADLESLMQGPRRLASLTSMFRQIEDRCHAAAISPERRSRFALQLLVGRAADEEEGRDKPHEPLTFQDYSALGTAPRVATARLQGRIKELIEGHNAVLRIDLPPHVDVPDDVLLGCVAILSRVLISKVSTSVFQDFFMTFVKEVYRWDQAMYFTPTEVTDTVVAALNPQPKHRCCDPASGVGDFLTSFLSYRPSQQAKQRVFGIDLAEHAVEISRLNLLFGGGQPTNIAHGDTLLRVAELRGDVSARRKQASSIDFLNSLGWIQRGAVNPPFGTKIVETREEILRGFDLGHTWERNNKGELHPTKMLLHAQEVGILFAEAQTWLTEPGGAFGIILPNGYLGNTRDRAVAVREFLLRHNRLVSLLAFPRFTFKSSGADVSATAVIFERRKQSLRSASEDDQYMFHAYLIEHIGKQLGDKLGKRLLIRNPITGEPERDEQNELRVLTDLPDYLEDLRRSAAVRSFPWLIEGLSIESSTRRGHAIPIAEVLGDRHLTMDAKRFSPKYRDLADEIRSGPHFRLGDVVDFVPEAREEVTNASGKKRLVRRKFDAGSLFRYVDIESITDAGIYTPEARRGWELPERARRVGRRGDIFVAAIWSSVRKWALVSSDDADLLFTNGCHQLRIKPGQEQFLVDVVAGLAKESYAVQMRALARGSDGLAEISEGDASKVLVARVEDAAARARIQDEIDRLLAGQVSIRDVAETFSSRDEGYFLEPALRASHTSLV